MAFQWNLKSYNNSKKKWIFAKSCQFFILLQKDSNAQQRSYLYERTLNQVKQVQKKYFKIYNFSKKKPFLLFFELQYLGDMKS